MELHNRLLVPAYIISVYTRNFLFVPGFISCRDSILFALANSGTSILAGFVIFAVLGHMAHLHNIPVSEVAAAGKTGIHVLCGSDI